MGVTFALAALGPGHNKPLPSKQTLGLVLSFHCVSVGVETTVGVVPVSI